MPQRKAKPKLNPMRWCPVHEYDRWRCDRDCEQQRIDAARAATALRRYFSDRHHGQVPRAKYLAALEAAHARPE